MLSAMPLMQLSKCGNDMTEPFLIDAYNKSKYSRLLLRVAGDVGN